MQVLRFSVVYITIGQTSVSQSPLIFYLFIELSSRWELTNSLIDWNCSVNDEKGLLHSAAEHKDKIEVLSMEVKVKDDVEISEVELAAGLFWEMTYLEPKKDS